MPSVVYNVLIVETAPSSVIHRGDSYLISPTSSQKTYLGSGGSTVGDVGATFNVISKTVVDDQDFYELETTKAGTIA